MWIDFSIGYLLVYLAIGLVLIIPGLILQLVKEKMNLNHASSDLLDLTVIIPFRNEKDNLPLLLKSFKQSLKLPFQIFFVNDHSEDNGVERIQDYLTDNRFVILALPKEIKGKKEAIRFAMRYVKTNYVLTMDADIQFLPNYFSSLEKIKWNDLEVLPVRMISHCFYGRFTEIDHFLVNALNICVSGWKRPFVASGANLLFDRKSFEKMDQFHLHKHLPSGDDVYLLRDFRTAGATIKLYSALELSVSTSPPRSFKEFLAQRLRWFAKTGDVKDALANSVVFVQSVLMIVYVLLLIGFIYSGEWSHVLFFWMMKSSVDLFVFFPFFLRARRLFTWLLLPLFEWLFPFFACIMVISAFVFRPKWKGRIIRIR